MLFSGNIKGIYNKKDNIFRGGFIYKGDTILGFESSGFEGELSSKVETCLEINCQLTKLEC